MAGPSYPVRFGLFLFDPGRLELLKAGRTVRLAPQPAQILRLLLEAPGEVVTRERLRESLWPAGTYVEFELSLNTAVNRLRRALGDSGDSPRFIETVPKIGYRFLAPVSVDAPAAVPPPVDPPTPAPGTPRRWWLAAAGVAALALPAGWLLRHSAVEGASRSTIQLPAGHDLMDLAIAHSGDHFAYVSRKDNERTVYRRYFNEDYSRRVEGADGAIRLAFSPDDRELLCSTQHALRVVSPDGHARDLATLDDGWDLSAMEWGPDGAVTYSLSSGIWRVAGGAPPRLVLPPKAMPRGLEYPVVQSAAGDYLMFCARRGPAQSVLRAIANRDGRTWDIVEPAQSGVIAGNFLAFASGPDLMAAPFDPREGKVRGPAVPVASEILPRGWNGVLAGVAKTGRVVYAPSPAPRRLAWLDRRGKAAPLPLPAAEYEQVRLAPHGDRLAVVHREGMLRWRVAIVDLRTSQWTQLLTTRQPRPRIAWSPDGTSLAISSDQGNGDFFNLYQVDATGGGATVRLTEQPNFGQFPLSWTASGDGALLFAEGIHPDTKVDVKLFSFRDRTVRALVEEPGWDVDATFSPDGKWVAYASEEKGGSGVYVRQWQGKGEQPRFVAKGRSAMWEAGGQALIYLTSAGSFLRVEVANGRAGKPQPYIDGESPGVTRFDSWTRPFDLAADGRILTILPAPSAKADRVVVLSSIAAEAAHAGR